MLKVYLPIAGYVIGVILLWGVLSYATLEPNPMEWGSGTRLIHVMFPFITAAMGFALGDLLDE